MNNIVSILEKTGSLTSEQVFHTIIMRKKEACNMHEALVSAFKMLGHHALKRWNRYRERCEHFELYCAQDTCHEVFGKTYVPEPEMEEDLKQTLNTIHTNFTFNAIEAAEKAGTLANSYVSIFKWLIPYIYYWENETIAFYSGCIYHLTQNKDFALVPIVEKYACDVASEKNDFRRTYERMCRKSYSMDVVFDDVYNKKWHDEIEKAEEKDMKAYY